MDQTKLYDESTLLFATPSFKRGMARVVAPLGRLVSYNYSRDSKAADVRALRSDWRAVGRDLLESQREFSARVTS